MTYLLHGRYQVLSWPRGTDLAIDDLWTFCPEVVLGRYLVSTSFDSGVLTLTTDMTVAGWHTVGRFPHSPAIRRIDEIPHDQFDEWMVFESPVTGFDYESFVNHCFFAPGAAGYEEESRRFWEQVEALNPLHVLGENYGTYFVSRDAHIASRIQDAEPSGAANRR